LFIIICSRNPNDTEGKGRALYSAELATQKKNMTMEALKERFTTSGSGLEVMRSVNSAGEEEFLFQGQKAVTWLSMHARCRYPAK
tara:strand:+ start:158 stop:412 length:255 start_codon:yes stop_codon:yes gene_type:complete